MVNQNGRLVTVSSLFVALIIYETVCFGLRHQCISTFLICCKVLTDVTLQSPLQENLGKPKNLNHLLYSIHRYSSATPCSRILPCLAATKLQLKMREGMIS